MERSEYEKRLSRRLGAGMKLMQHTSRKDQDGDILFDAVNPRSVTIFESQGWKHAVAAPVQIEKDEEGIEGEPVEKKTRRKA